MTHAPPGLGLIHGSQDIRATIQLVNDGHTPADVIGYDVTLVRGPLVNNPGRPPIPTNEPVLFIMPNANVGLWQNWQSTLEEINAIETGVLPVALVGWVVYRDRFGKRHRSGYARRYNAPIPGSSNNLVFVTEPGYNYEEDLD